ncbi:MAG: hypothetical protein RBR08_07900 [Desulforegulaceae bacterium]|nr:hypothetical protein [Desulforegulaceae bacterium]
MNVKHLLFIASLLIVPSLVNSQQINIEISNDGQVGEIYYKNISVDYRPTILAQLVSDDVIKKAKSLANEKRYLEAHELLTTVTYLDYNNTTSLILSSSYLKKIMTSENDKKKLFKMFTSEVKSGLKRKKSSHNIDCERGLIMAQEAMSLYPVNSEENKAAASLVKQVKNHIKTEDATNEILAKLRGKAEKAKQQGEHIQAIQNFAILYYAENSTYPLIQIVKILNHLN